MKIKKNSTLDLNEKKKFETFYNEWWDLKGPFEPLHNFNKLRIKYIKQALKIKSNSFSIFKNLEVLDIGCGGGILSEPMRRLGANITGIDVNKKAIDIAKEHSIRQGLKINYYNNEISNFKNKKKFDLVICMEILEHLKDINFFLKCCKKHLKNNGVLIGSTINKTLKSYLLAIIMAEKLLKIIPNNTHNWEKFLSPNLLKKYLIMNNFKEIQFQGSTYNPIVKNWKFIQSLDVNYFFSAKI